MGLLRGAVAHDVEQSPRTEDVVLRDSITFSDMLLSQSTLSGLHSAGFRRPSPIQRSAIPLGRCGTDLIVQAKSGTGKTLVFTIIALEMLDLTIPQLQVLIMAPTREIAVQIKEVFSSIASGYPGLEVSAFIGGLPLSADVSAAKQCQVAVGTPGRVKQLVTAGDLRLSSVRLFILDEADRLVEKSFRNDVNFIFSKLPENKQSLVVSATFPPKLEEFLKGYLVHPCRVNPSTDTLLLGLRQFVAVTRAHTNVLVRVRNKTARLLQILSSLSFRQCLVFCNVQSRMESICRDLASRGWPALHLTGSMPQTERLAAVAALQNQRCRVLLSTDLASRGVDAEQVDLVVSLDLPYDSETYLHRIGRAGRFGASGVAVSVVDDGPELADLRRILFEVGGPSFRVPVLPVGELPPGIWTNHSELDTMESLDRAEEQTNGHGEAAMRSDCEEDPAKCEPHLSLPSSENCETSASEPLHEKEAIELFRTQLVKLRTDVRPVTFDVLNDMFNTKNLNLAAGEPHHVSEIRGIELETVEEALKCLRIYDSTNSQLSRNNVEKQSEPQYKTDEKHESQSSEDDDGAALNGISYDDDEEYLTEHSVEDATFQREHFSEEYGEYFSGDCSGDLDEHEGSETESYNSFSADERPAREDCQICRSWFNDWRNQLAAQRQSLQTQLYMQEMLK